MLCDNCHKEPATVYVRRTTNGEITEAHLCDKCAREQGEWNLFIGSSLAFPDFSLGNLFASLIDQQLGAGGAVAGTKGLTCPVCGLTYAEFRGGGRLGCAECYVAFIEMLKPLIKRLQGGLNHSGKVPNRHGLGTPRLRHNLVKLRQQLEDAVSHEKFEQAAKLRDEIKLTEKRLLEG